MSSVRVRRARRQDLPRLAPLLGDAAGPDRRFFRRLLADLGTDVYVAEAPDGGLVGLVAVVYVRSLAAGRAAAILDAVRMLPGAPEVLLDDLLAVAATRARRRGCTALQAPWPGDDPSLRAALLARGFSEASGLAQAVGAPG